MARLIPVLALFVAAVFASGGLTGCAGDQPTSQDPLNETRPEIPDAPGDAAAPKPAASAEAEPTKAMANEKTVVPGALNVREEPSNIGKVLRTVKKGEKVSVESCAKGWCKLSDGGYVGQKQLQ